jgi:putative nucleotidyltransferase with HDIG domain
MDAIDELLKSVETLPTAPKVLPNLLAALSDIDSDFDRVVQLITIDPALTAKVLQVCNSAYYAFPTRASTVEDSISRLGFHGIYMIVAVASSENIMKTSAHSALDPDAMWRHLVGAAVAAQVIGKKMRLDGNLLFTAGLLHDIGKLPLAEALSGDYDGLVTDASLFGRPLAELETASFGLNHAEVGARLLENWAFAPELIETVRWHHESANAGEHAAMAACVELADLIAHSLEPADPEAPFAAMEIEPAMIAAGLSFEELLEERERVQAKLPMIEALCG